MDIQDIFSCLSANGKLEMVNPSVSGMICGLGIALYLSNQYSMLGISKSHVGNIFGENITNEGSVRGGISL